MERAVLVSDASLLEAAELRALAELATRDAGDRDLPSPGSMTLDEMERAMITRCLAHFDRNVTKAAEALGLSRPALYRRIEKYRLRGTD